jgi:hypothetical protein
MSLVFAPVQWHFNIVGKYCSFAEWIKLTLSGEVDICQPACFIPTLFDGFQQNLILVIHTKTCRYITFWYASVKQYFKSNSYICEKKISSKRQWPHEDLQHLFRSINIFISLHIIVRLLSTRT